jgi:dihydrofolate reductase
MANLIVGAARNGVIGQGLKIPWHYPEDLKWFKKNTLNGVLVMGRKTYESLPGKLPGREMIVLSRGAEVYPNRVPTLMDALYLAGTRWPQRPVWIVGGAAVYLEAIRLNVVSQLLYTEIPEEPPIDEGTVRLPPNFLRGFELVQTVVNAADDRLTHKVYQCLQH